MDLSSGSLDISAEVEVVSRNVRKCPNDGCSYTTVNKSNLNKHMKRMHPPLNTSTPLKTAVPPPLHLCDACGKSFKSRFGLNLHIKSKHTKDFKYVCHICDKGYNQRIQFRFHVSSHSGVGMESCKFCKESFCSSGSLARHLETCQQKPKPFVCDVCQSAFARKYKRDEHKRGKHGEKRYACEGCGKQFGWRSSLKVHRRRCGQQQ